MHQSNAEKTIRRKRAIQNLMANNKWSPIKTTDLNLLSIPLTLAVCPLGPGSIQQTQQMHKTLTPLQKLRKIRQKMTNGLSQKKRTRQSFCFKAHTIDVRDHSSNNPNQNKIKHGAFRQSFERKITQFSNNQMPGQMMARYFNHLRNKAYSSLDRRPTSTRKCRLPIRWLEETQKKKHSFVDKLTQQHKKSTPSSGSTDKSEEKPEIKEYEMKYVNRDEYSPIRIMSGMPLNKTIFKSPTQKQQNFKQFKERRLKPAEDYSQLKPWDDFQDDCVLFT